MAVEKRKSTGEEDRRIGARAWSHVKLGKDLEQEKPGVIKEVWWQDGSVSYRRTLRVEAKPQPKSDNRETIWKKGGIQRKKMREV